MALHKAPLERSIALNRFGLSLHAAEADLTGSRKWLLEQFPLYEAVPAVARDARTSAAIARQFAPASDDSLSNTAVEGRREDARAIYDAELRLRVKMALTSQAPFIERMVHFWTGYFAITSDKTLVNVLAGALEREAIRPHVLGRFEDMLLAVARHGATQIHLEQMMSTGMNSHAGRQARTLTGADPLTVREGLARMIIERHTLGPGGGHKEADIAELATALTGWSLLRPGEADTDLFAYRPGLHEPSERQVLGRAYPQRGLAQPLAILADLARAEATACHVADSLVRHLIADTPPPDLVSRVAAAFSSSGGDLSLVYRVLIESPQAWQPAPAKVKTPWEWTISAMRVLGYFDAGTLSLPSLFSAMKQPIWRPPHHVEGAGASAWTDDKARRVQATVAQSLVDRMEQALDPILLIRRAFPAGISASTKRDLLRAPSSPARLKVLLLSVDFNSR
jgi:uncharacterized protein (DUF1800 family)